MELLDLNDEFLLTILNYLDYGSLLHLSGTTKELHYLIQNDSFWKMRFFSHFSHVTPTVEYCARDRKSYLESLRFDQKDQLGDLLEPSLWQQLFYLYSTKTKNLENFFDFKKKALLEHPKDVQRYVSILQRIVSKVRYHFCNFILKPLIISESNRNFSDLLKGLNLRIDEEFDPLFVQIGWVSSIIIQIGFTKKNRDLQILLIENNSILYKYIIKNEELFSNNGFVDLDKEFEEEKKSKIQFQQYFTLDPHSLSNNEKNEKEKEIKEDKKLKKEIEIQKEISKKTKIEIEIEKEKEKETEEEEIIEFKKFEFQELSNTKIQTQIKIEDMIIKKLLVAIKLIFKKKELFTFISFNRYYTNKASIRYDKIEHRNFPWLKTHQWTENYFFKNERKAMHHRFDERMKIISGIELSKLGLSFQQLKEFNLFELEKEVIKFLDTTKPILFDQRCIDLAIENNQRYYRKIKDKRKQLKKNWKKKKINHFKIKITRYHSKQTKLGNDFNLQMALEKMEKMIQKEPFPIFFGNKNWKQKSYSKNLKIAYLRIVKRYISSLLLPILLKWWPWPSDTLIFGNDPLDMMNDLFFQSPKINFFHGDISICHSNFKIWPLFLVNMALKLIPLISSLVTLQIKNNFYKKCKIINSFSNIKKIDMEKQLLQIKKKILKYNIDEEYIDELINLNINSNDEDEDEDDDNDDDSNN
ncbi:f-box only protein [Anaeramoeba flamelloides]|uniref:F-box only protein n=1 Tax=Anaeramoeba flamelloides TaxID=1746091 RepID=A0ABQ8XJV2_9EUKA|nr:f-box only protein [Anaeramoeba flamelloides]